MTDRRRIIMLVDDNMTNLSMGKNMLKDYYVVYPVPSAAKFFSLLEKVTPDIVLLDIEMPEMSGYETIRILKSNPTYAHIPVIFLTSKNDPGSEREGMNLGAVDYVSKPFSPPMLLNRIENHLRNAEMQNISFDI